MENSFETELLQHGTNYDEQIELLYQKLQKYVVLIEVPLPGQKEDILCSWGGGCFFDKSGLILTCAHVIVENCSKIYFRCYNDYELEEAKLVYIDRRSDFAILKSLKEIDASQSIVEFADVNSVEVGMKTFSLSHPCNMVYTLGQGEVGYPCPISTHTWDASALTVNPPTRLAGNVRREVDTDLASYPTNLKVIQINNVHGSTGSSGCPVFNSSGLVIGIHLFVNDGFDYCGHVSELIHFINESKKHYKKNIQESKKLMRKKQRLEKLAAHRHRWWWIKN